MIIQEALIQAVSKYGKEVLADSQLLSIIDDFHGFEEMPAARYILKLLQKNGCIDRIIDEDDFTQMRVLLMAQKLNYLFGYDTKMVEQIIKSLNTAIIANLSTEVKKEDFANARKDDTRTYYSKDGLRLLHSRENLKIHYTIAQNTQVICDEAFDEGWRWFSKSAECDEGFSLNSVVIPDSVLKIGDRAFASCVFLKEVTLPQKLVFIGEAAFSSCSSLQIITFPESLVHICDRAYDGCSSLQTIVFRECLAHIGNNAFRGCYSLSTIFIPGGTRSHFEKQLPNELHHIIIEMNQQT